MAEGSLTKALKVIEKEVKDREEFRRVFSNRKVHVFKISVKDITKQCMIEIEARLLADQIELGTTNKKGKKLSGGLLNKDGTLFVSKGKTLSKTEIKKHPLYKALGS